jgi:hypothetical protein
MLCLLVDLCPSAGEISHRNLFFPPIFIFRPFRFHLTPVRMAKIKNSGDSRCWRGCGERGTSSVLTTLTKRETSYPSWLPEYSVHVDSLASVSQKTREGCEGE